jgi:hypothetical protein
MKKHLVYMAAAIFSIQILSINSNAQSISVGAGAGYDFKGNAGGVNLKGYWNLSYRLSIGAEGDYFPGFRIGETQGQSGNKSVFHLNARYNIYIRENCDVLIYPFSGIAYARQVETDPALNTELRTVKVAPGLNLGLGAGYQYGRILWFTEYRYTLSELNGNMISVGILIKDLMGKAN